MLRDIVYKIIDTVESGYSTVLGYANHLTFFLIVIDIALFGIYVAMGKSASIESVIEKILSITFFLYFINNFHYLATQFLSYIIKASSSVGGNFDHQFFFNPDAIIKYATTDILIPLEKTIRAVQPKEFWNQDIGLWLMFGVTEICVIVCFSIIALQLVIANIEFHVITLMGVVLIPFCFLEQTRFVGMKVFPSVAGQAIKCGAASLIAGVGISVFKSQLSFSSVGDALSMTSIHFLSVLIGSSMLLAFLALQVPALAASMLSGMPNLGLSGFVQNMSEISRPMTSGANNIGDRANAGYQTTKDIAVGAANTVKSLNERFK